MRSPLQQGESWLTGGMMAETTLQGIGVSAGFAVGPVFQYKPLHLNVSPRQQVNPDEEFGRFVAAREQAKRELQSIKQSVEARAGKESAEIFDAHMVLLADPMLEDSIKAQIGDGAETAVRQASEALAEMLRQSGDEMFAARAVDVTDIGQRLLRILLGVPDQSLNAIHQPSILIAHDLTPSDTANLDPQQVIGICLKAGGRTSHAAILARTLGIPAVVGLGEAIDPVNDGAVLALDGASGEVIINPLPEKLALYQQKRETRSTREAQIRAKAHQPAVNAGGRRIPVYANIGDLASAKKAIEEGAEGVGLLRTEFLYLNESSAPGEDYQVEVYQAIFDVMGERPVTIRTLDLGGDKPPSFIDFPQEENPFLGWRGIRVCLDMPDLFKTQLRAILRAAVAKPISLMYPMIESVSTLRRANLLLKEAQRELDAANVDYNRSVPVGIMIETPSAAVMTDLLAAECDFFSIGTNDLTQYALACERGNGRVAGYFEDLSPGVLRLIRQTIDHAHAAGKEVSMCGELAGMPAAIPILLGLGLDKFSMSAPAIPQAKWILNGLSDAQARELAQHSLNLPTADDIQNYMQANAKAFSD
jgi:phosphoenolpyruvate-protein phosphotransferase